MNKKFMFLILGFLFLSIYMLFFTGSGVEKIHTIKVSDGIEKNDSYFYRVDNVMHLFDSHYQLNKYSISDLDTSFEVINFGDSKYVSSKDFKSLKLNDGYVRFHSKIEKSSFSQDLYESFQKTGMGILFVMILFLIVLLAVTKKDGEENDY